MPRIRTLTPGLRSTLGAVALSIMLTACGGGGGQSGTSPLAAGCDPTNPASCGTVLITLTDADGDFTSYTVDVLSISLERANGTRIETLPTATRVDFAALTDLADLVSAAALSPADIVGGRIRLDYADAEIYVESGGAIVAATAVDSAGSPLGVVDVEIRLDDRERLVVTRGRTHLLQIDFDLAASHVVDATTVPAIATAEPFLIAEAQPLEQKELRVRGALVDVDSAEASYEVRVRPWHSRIGDHGVVTVATTPSTEFEIDGEVLVGSDGIDALAGLPTGTLTVAFGVLDAADRRFTASIVHAGNSVGGDATTAIHGNIVSRTGDQLVVRGAIAVLNDRRARYHRTVIVEVGPDTGVTRQGAGTSAFATDALSVGQRIVALGTLTNPSVAEADPAGPDVALLLDATSGRVRMLPTRLTGTVTSFLPGQVNLSLRAIDRLGVGLFDFAGTGTAPATDADPADYEVATGTLPLTTLESGRPVRVIGFVNGFGAAPPDFSGRTIIGPRELRAALGIGWEPSGSAAPFQVMTAASLVADLTNPEIGERHHLLLGTTLLDLFDLPASPSIEPAGTRGLYAVTEPGHVELFSRFPDFVDELALRLGGGATARSLAAYGSYAEPMNSLESQRIIVRMLPAE